MNINLIRDFIAWIRGMAHYVLTHQSWMGITGILTFFMFVIAFWGLQIQRRTSTNSPDVPSQYVVPPAATPPDEPVLPVLVDDRYEIDEGGTVDKTEANVCANDEGIDFANLQVRQEQGPQYGDLELNRDGTFTYVHDGTENHEDKFTYGVGSDSADVTIKIRPVNDDPEPENHQFRLREGGTVEGSVAPNVKDADSDTFRFDVVNNTRVGNLAFRPEGTFTYRHDGTEEFRDSFTYRVIDDAGGSGTAEVDFTVEPVNDPPLAGNDRFTLVRGESVEFSATELLQNDEDAEGTSLNIVFDKAPAHGRLRKTAGNTFQYTHDGGPEKTDTFSYFASDGQSRSEPATVLLNIRSDKVVPFDLRNFSFGSLPNGFKRVGDAEEVDKVEREGLEIFGDFHLSFQVGVEAVPNSRGGRGLQVTLIGADGRDLVVGAWAYEFWSDNSTWAVRAGEHSIDRMPLKSGARTFSLRLEDGFFTVSVDQDNIRRGAKPLPYRFSARPFDGFTGIRLGVNRNVKVQYVKLVPLAKR